MLKAHLHVIKDDVALKQLKPVSDFALLKQKTDLRQLEHSKQLKSSRQLPRTLTVLNVGFKWL